MRPRFAANDMVIGLGNVPLSGDLPPPEPIEGFHLEDVVCHESLGGLLKHYERKAA